MLLFLLNMFDKNKDEDKTPEEETTEENNEEEEYLNDIEKNLGRILESIEGVGETELMITLKGSTSKVYAKEESDNISQDKAESHFNYVMIENESDGLLLSVENPDIMGAVVICEGGDSSVVKEKVYKTVSVVLGIGRNQIYVGAKAG